MRERLGVLVSAATFLNLYSIFYTVWKLPPQLSLGSVGVILGGDVLPLLVAPLLLIRFVLGRPLSDYGWRWPGWGELFTGAGIAYLGLLPLVFGLSLQPEFQAFYPSPVFPPAREHAIGLAFLWGLHHGPQLFALEFCWRGFLLLPLTRRFGLARALLGVLAFYVLLHADKPRLELLEAAWGGLLFGWVAWRSRSFLPAFAAHWLVAVTMDALCFLWLHGVRL